MKKFLLFFIIIFIFSCNKKEEKSTQLFEENETKNYFLIQNNNTNQTKNFINKIEENPKNNNYYKMNIVKTKVVNYMMKENTKLSKETAEKIFEIVKKISFEEKISPVFALAIMNVESHFNHSIISSAGAIGIMQLMPSNEKEYGVNIYELEQNIKGGIKHFKNDLKANNGNITLSLAAYNSGQGKVNNNSWYQIKETRDYVFKVSNKINLISSFFKI